jgi:hypothetical protein
VPAVRPHALGVFDVVHRRGQRCLCLHLDAVEKLARGA